MYSVPRMAFFRPPPVPVVLVVITLNSKCGTARTMMPPASHTRGTTIAARPTKHSAQKIAFQIFLARGTAGQSPDRYRDGVEIPVSAPTPPGRPFCRDCSWLHSPLPTGSAVPDTRRTISRAATLVSSVMTSRTSASSA